MITNSKLKKLIVIIILSIKIEKQTEDNKDTEIKERNAAEKEKT